MTSFSSSSFVYVKLVDEHGQFLPTPDPLQISGLSQEYNNLDYCYFLGLKNYFHCAAHQLVLSIAPQVQALFL